MPLQPAEYGVLVEQSPIMIWRSDDQGRCNYFNERWYSFTGRTPEEEANDGWAEGVHRDDLEHCLTIYRDHFARRAIFEMEYRLRRQDGHYRWIFDRGVPYHTESTGAFGGFIGSCIDVTDRVEAQTAVRHAHEAELAALRGLLPICMHCKRIRDERGHWQPVEVYIRERSRADFSHGLCPECGKAHYR